MVVYIKNDLDIQLYDIEFNDLSHITNLSEDCFGIIKEFCERSWFGDLTKIDKYKLFWMACENGLYDVVGEIFERGDKDDIFCEHPNDRKEYILYHKKNNVQFYGFHLAIKHGHFKMATWMKSEFSYMIDYVFTGDEQFNEFRWACYNGHLKTLDWIKNEFPDLIKEAFQCRYFYPFQDACRSGQIEVLNWMKKEFPDLINIAFRAFYYDGFHQACKYGQLKVLVWMNKEFPSMINDAIHSVDKNGTSWAFEKGYLKVRALIKTMLNK